VSYRVHASAAEVFAVCSVIRLVPNKAADDSACTKGNFARSLACVAAAGCADVIRC
jgi:hypothetical protein